MLIDFRSHHLSALVLVLALAGGEGASAADWPQFMRDPAHTGDAADETLRLPLGIVAQVKLDDAVMTAPAVVAGRAYVVDQMGTAYCIDPRAGRVLWKAAPDGASAMGANTSSPCVVKGRVYYGTTAGTFHILDARDGKVIKTQNVGSPLVSAPTFANGSIYFQALDAVLRCFDLDGNERWKWDHYAQYQEPPEVTKARQQERGHPGGYDRLQYGGEEVAVSGKLLVTSFGWDSVCLQDAGTEAKLVWCNRAPNGRDGAAPMSSSISGDWIYTTGMGADGHRATTRLSLRDGHRPRETSGQKSAYPWCTPAVRGATATVRDSSYGKDGIVVFDYEAGKTLASWRDGKDATPIASSHALTKDHLVATTLRGEVIVVELTARAGAKPYRFQTPHGKGIGSSPAVADGCVFFGCDDGYLYVLGQEGERKPTLADRLTVHEPRSPLRPATGKTYSWPSTHGNPGSTAFADDANLKPPFRVRWATRTFGSYYAPCVATEQDVIHVTLTGLLTCQEQATGRLRWRVQMPGPEWMNAAGLVASDGRLFLARPNQYSHDGALYCLDVRTGQTIWTAELGGRHIWERSSPVVADGRVVFGFSQKGTPPGTLIQAWEVDTGKPAWRVELNVAGSRAGSIAGCTDGKSMVWTAGAQLWQWKQEGDKKRGETVAIEARSGKVLWRSHDLFGTSYPVLTEGRLLLNEQGTSLCCLSASDGKLLWKRTPAGSSRFSVGLDFIVQRGYGGHGGKLRLEDGKDYPGCRELGGETHGCGAVALTPNLSFALTVGGLNVRDVRNGDLLWLSPGFAPRGCTNVVLANGRVFWPSGASGLIYCWEPQSEEK